MTNNWQKPWTLPTSQRGALDIIPGLGVLGLLALSLGLGTLTLTQQT